MKQFTQPDFGNVGRTGSPVNAIKNLQKKLNRQLRAKKDYL